MIYDSLSLEACTQILYPKLPKGLSSKKFLTVFCRTESQHILSANKDRPVFIVSQIGLLQSTYDSASNEVWFLWQGLSPQRLLTRERHWEPRNPQLPRLINPNIINNHRKKLTELKLISKRNAFVPSLQSWCFQHYVTAEATWLMLCQQIFLTPQYFFSTRHETGHIYLLWKNPQSAILQTAVSTGTVLSPYD